MANLTEKIEIESFEKFQDEILAEDTTGRQHIISMPAFERWLLISGIVNGYWMYQKLVNMPNQPVP